MTVVSAENLTLETKNKCHSKVVLTGLGGLALVAPIALAINGWRSHEAYPEKLHREQLHLQQVTAVVHADQQNLALHPGDTKITLELKKDQAEMAKINDTIGDLQFHEHGPIGDVSIGAVEGIGIDGAIVWFGLAASQAG